MILSTLKWLPGNTETPTEYDHVVKKMRRID